jgi:ABC-type nitrate/sulfonate/bicarbonate transport system permease component
MTSLNTPVESPDRAPDARRGVGDVISTPADGGRGSGRVQRVGLRTAGIGVALLLWHLYATGPGSAVSLPTPMQVMERLAELGNERAYWVSILQTLWMAALGLLLSIAVGVPLGLINGTFRRVAMSTQFLVDFLRTVPPIAVVPLFLLVWGGTTQMALILIVFGAVWPLLIQATYAAQQVSPQLKQVATAFQLTRVERLRIIYVPSVTPFLMTGFRIAATLSLLLAVVAGFFGGVPGLGKDLYESLEISDPPTMFVYSTTIALLGVLLNTLLLGMQAKLLWWHPSVRGDQS